MWSDLKKVDKNFITYTETGKLVLLSPPKHQPRQKKL